MPGPIRYFKSDPTDYILVYRNGAVTREGAGLCFFFWAPTTSIASIPIGTIDLPFILNETTGNFQAVTVQGQLTYHVVAPKTMAGILNFVIDPRTRAYVSNDAEKLPQRIVNIVQTHVRAELLKLPLEDALRSATGVAATVLAKVAADPGLAAMGVECQNLFITAIKPTPEMAKALEAEYREGLQQRADQAIYARRAAAVEQERHIKENELKTELLLELRRQELVDLQGQNKIREAESDARANEISLKPWRDADPRTLVALGLKNLGEHAEKIGNLTITPELLASVLGGPLRS
jgi:regulator of protease activity HflC (stomatin/prohibitin superfamily)